MVRFAAARGCRMMHLIKHFGDLADDGGACGVCDMCDPDACIAQEFNGPSPDEPVHASRILAALTRADGQAAGRLHLETFPGGDVDRRSFEHILNNLLAEGLVTREKTSFAKRGKVIPFERVSLTAAGHAHALTAAGLLLPAPAAAKRSKRAAKSRPRKRRKTTAKRTTTKRAPAKRTAAKRAPTTRRTRAPVAP